MGLSRFLLRRFIWGIFTVFGVIVITFAISHVIPADPVALIAGDQSTPEQIEELRKRLGFDKSIMVQFQHYTANLLNGDLGNSLFTGRPVSSDLFSRLPATIELTIVALAITVGLGVPVGVVAALRRNSLFDHVIRIVTVSGLAVASFWLAIMLQLWFAMNLGWLPLGGRIAATMMPPRHVTGLYLVDSLLEGNWAAFGSSLSHIVLPAITLAFPALATIVRFSRVGVLDAINKPFVQYERSMGLPESIIIWKYVLRNALTATVMQIGLLAGVLLGGSVVVEAIFDWPGLGYYAVNSIIMSDYNAVLGFTIWVSVIYVLANIAVDIAHSLIDPREVG